MAAMTGAILGGVGALTSAAGGIASAVGAASRPDLKFDMGQESAFEREGANAAASGFQGYQRALGNEFAAGQSAQMDFASMLRQYSQDGAIPTGQDIARSQQFARTQFDPQRVAMQQAFEMQVQQANRQAAVSGRGVNDPVLRAKLAQEQMRQGQQLEAQQGAFASQFAMQQPLQRLGFMGQAADTLSQRGTMALNAQMGQVGMGLQAQQQGFGQRFNTAQARYMEQANIRSEGEKIGGVLGAVGGGISAVGSIAGAAGGMPGMGGGGGIGGGNCGKMFGAGFGTLGGGGGGAPAAPSGGGGGLQSYPVNLKAGPQPLAGPWSPEYMQQQGVLPR
jgi:hypothetical protein